MHLLLCAECAGAFVWSADLYDKDCSATEIARLVLGEDHVLLPLRIYRFDCDKQWAVRCMHVYSIAEIFQLSRYFHLDRFGSEASIPIPDSKPEVSLTAQYKTFFHCIWTVCIVWCWLCIHSTLVLVVAMSTPHACSLVMTVAALRLMMPLKACSLRLVNWRKK